MFTLRLVGRGQLGITPSTTQCNQGAGRVRRAWLTYGLAPVQYKKTHLFTLIKERERRCFCESFRRSSTPMLRCFVCGEAVSCVTPADFHAHVNSCLLLSDVRVGTAANEPDVTSLFRWRMPKSAAIAAFLPERFPLIGSPPAAALATAAASDSASSSSALSASAAAIDESFASFEAGETARLARLTPAHVLGNVRGGFCYALNDTDADVVADLENGCQLFLGSEAAARSARFLAANRIRVILNCAANSVPLPAATLRASGVLESRYKRERMDDKREESNRGQLEAAALWLHQQVSALHDTTRALEASSLSASPTPVAAEVRTHAPTAASDAATYRSMSSPAEAADGAPAAGGAGIDIGHRHDSSDNNDGLSATGHRSIDAKPGSITDSFGMSQGGNVLVHCVGGMSRSTAVVLAYLVVHRRMTLLNAALQVKAARPLIYPIRAFWEALIEIERDTHGGNVTMTHAMLDAHHRDVYDPASRFPFDNIRLPLAVPDPDST